MFKINLLILRKLYEIIKKGNEILAQLVALNFARSDSVDENWIDGVEVQRILKISESTLYRLKKNKILNPSRLGGKDYYNAAEINQSLRKYMK